MENIAHIQGMTVLAVGIIFGMGALGTAIGFGILGGLTPMVAVYTINRSHDDLSLAFLLMAAAAVSSIVIAGLRETSNLALANLQDGESAVAPAGERNRVVEQADRVCFRAG